MLNLLTVSVMRGLKLLIFCLTLFMYISAIKCIQIGTKCATLIVDLSLYGYESQYMAKLCRPVYTTFTTKGAIYLDGDFPLAPSYCDYISELVRYVRISFGSSAVHVENLLQALPKFYNDVVYGARKIYDPALKCYDCTDINEPGNCTSFKTCSSSDEYCFSAQSFTNSLHQAYRLGCSTKDTCDQFARSQQKRVNFDAGCCNHDKCNNKPPSLLHITSLPTPDPIVPTSGSDFCVNKDEDTCQRFALLYPNPCQYDCVKALCPHMCQQCFYCLNCDGISNPNQCQQITVCGNGTVCYGYEKLNNDLQIVVELGCMDNQQCSSLMSPANHPFNQFGRKRDFGLIGGCCTGDRCNLHPNGVPVVTTTHLATTTTPTTTVTVPNHTVPVNNCTSYVYRDCPPGFVPHGHYCYNIGNQTLNKQQAEDYCHQRCASLVKFSDKTEILEVFSYFQHINHEVYTSLTRDIKHQYWYWESDDTLVSKQLLENDFQLTQDSCAVAYITFSVGIHSHSVYTYGLSPVSCTHNAVSMCYIRRST